MKHPKDRGTRQRANYQHKALRQSGMFKMRVETDKRKEALARAFSDEQYALEEGLDDEGQHQPVALPKG